MAPGRDLALVMGRAWCDWIGWMSAPRKPRNAPRGFNEMLRCGKVDIGTYSASEPNRTGTMLS